MARGILVVMEESRHEPDLPDLRETGPDRGSDRIPKPFPLIRYYLIASVLLVIGAFAIINFSTQRIQSDTVIDRLREEAGRDVEHVLFEISLAITSYYHPGDDLATALASNKRALDRDVINALSGKPILRVDLLSPSGELVYSTDPEAGPALAAADSASVLSGLPASRYESEYPLTLFNGKSARIAAVITANPVSTEWSVDGVGPVAVLVAFRDVTGDVSSHSGQIAPERIAVIAGTMAGLFLLLSWIVVNGHRFTIRSREQLAGLLVTEREMRGQLDVRNAELEEANKAKSQFLSMVSHELKTPLTAIISFTQSLNKSLAGSLDERKARQFETLIRNGGHLKLLIDELLDVSAAAAGKLRVQFEEVTADLVAIEASQMAQPLFDARNQTLSVSTPDTEVTFSGDPGRLQQVIANLLSNASKYSPAGSEIRLDVMKVDDAICFRVIDQGNGISEADQKRLFSTFFRTDDAVSSWVPGTGLGLVIVRSIVEGHGGVVKIDSKLGSGTTASVVIPLKTVQPVVPADELDAAA